MLMDRHSAVQLEFIMGFDIPDRSSKGPAPGMAVIGMADLMFVVDLTDVTVFQFNIPDIPHMPGIIGDQCDIIRIGDKDRKVLPVDRPKLFCGKHLYHLAPGSATICALRLAFSNS